MSAKGSWRKIATCLMSIWIVGAADAEAARQDAAVKMSEERKIASCIRVAASGRNWLEKTLWGLRDQEGGWVGAEIANSDGSHDLGPLQVNSWWVGKIAKTIRRRPEQVRGWLANDACFNVNAARWIFLSALASSGEYWKAVGIYHSPTKWRQQRYAASVMNHLKRRYGSHAFKPDAANWLPGREAGSTARLISGPERSSRRSSQLSVKSLHGSRHLSNENHSVDRSR